MKTLTLELNGAKVTYRGRAGTVGFFVLWPFDWDKKPAGD